ncbi:MAG: 4Fe-4S dicluster domain-containing protein [Melioribacteraceae bacterium]
MKKLNSLKIFRIILSVVFFVPILIVFLDLADLVPHDMKLVFTNIQFIPAFLNFVQNPIIASVIFLSLIAITFLFGRIYCSSICPLGILQDIVYYFVLKINKRKRFLYEDPKNIFRYTILIVSVVLFFVGNILLLNLLDPYSLFGKMSANLLRPIAILVNNGAASILTSFDIYILFPVDIFFHLPVFIFSISMLAFIIWFVTKKGRLYCNMICPVGTFLGLVSRFSIFKIRIVEDDCTSCKVCEKKCRAMCIDSKGQLIDYSRCVDCFDCISACSSKAIIFSAKNPFVKDFPIPSENINAGLKSIDISKRDFVKTIIASFTIPSMILKAGETPKVYKNSTIAEDKNYLVTPPGSISIEHFNDYCTACNLCVTACPTKVLQPTFIEYGIFNVFQPKMDYHKGFCNFECKICSDICPTDAIIKISSLDEKKLVQIGKAHFIRENCVVITQGTDCGACNEHCPTKAVKMVPEDKLLVPKMEDDLCIGCGACEHACPTKPYKAIYVDGNLIHQTAKKPVVEKQKVIDTTEEFPF